jgi:hypothetical protein
MLCFFVFVDDSYRVIGLNSHRNVMAAAIRNHRDLAVFPCERVRLSYGVREKGGVHLNSQIDNALAGGTARNKPRRSGR